MLFSIIVPVYNVKAYLRKCVGSLLDQDIEASDYEILLVDDGSTDDSGILCDELAAAHGNIRVIHQKNGGLSAARNTGIKAASGEYIQFVDSDDYLNPCVLKGLLEQILAQRLDVLRYNYQNVNEEGEVFEPNKVSRPFVNYSKDVCGGESFLTERLGYACYACQFIVKASLINDGGGFFTEGIYFEDIDWTPRILLKANRVASTGQVVYNYLFRTGSITRTPDYGKQKKKLEDRLSIIDSLQELAKRSNDPIWFKGMISQIAISIVSAAGTDFYAERRAIIRTLRKKGVFPLSSFHATPAALRKIRIANISPALMCRLLHMKNH
jgi:glycosyltransferase involved in cell wall biosynthesis